jgi:hypothetical protein
VPSPLLRFFVCSVSLRAPPPEWLGFAFPFSYRYSISPTGFRAAGRRTLALRRLGSWFWTTFSSDRWHAVSALSESLLRSENCALGFDSWFGSSVQLIATGSLWFILVLAPVCESRTGTAVGVYSRLGFLCHQSGDSSRYRLPSISRAVRRQAITSRFVSCLRRSGSSSRDSCHPVSAIGVTDLGRCAPLRHRHV